MSTNTRIKASYQVQKIGNEYETFENRFSMKKGQDGTYRMEMESVATHGGYLFTMPNGSQIRLETLDQIKQFKLDTKPQLIDITTGEEVNEAGVPLSIANLVQGAVQEAMLPRPVAGDGGVESSIEALE